MEPIQGTILMAMRRRQKDLLQSKPLSRMLSSTSVMHITPTNRSAVARLRT